MTDPEEELTPELVDQRLRVLADLYRFGKALGEVRFVGLESSETVREPPPAPPPPRERP